MPYRNKRILVADDNEDILNMLQALLQSNGHSADGATDGKMALKMFYHARDTHQPYDLLLIDAAMPDLSGYEVTETIRKASEVPVLIFTGHDEPIVEPHARAVGATKVLYKPLDAPTLLDAVRAAL
jgi:DNA-binding response OmpR family regulator